MSTPSQKPIILKTLFKVLVLGAAIPVIVLGVFVATRETTPHVSELSFIEHSVLGEKAGSVIPASCDSVPPTSAHFPGDCDPVVNLGLQSGTQRIEVGMAVANLAIDQPRVGSPTITWNSTGATSCTATGGRSGDGWAGSKALSGSQTINYTNNDGVKIAVIYTITCSNSVQSVTKAKRVWFGTR
jgi:hypothetical protein